MSVYFQSSARFIRPHTETIGKNTMQFLGGFTQSVTKDSPKALMQHCHFLHACLNEMMKVVDDIQEKAEADDALWDDENECFRAEPQPKSEPEEVNYDR